MEQQELISNVVHFFFSELLVGPISQKVYRRDLFGLFKMGYPKVSAEDLEAAIFEDWDERGEEPDDAQKSRLERLTLAWTEWTYAWENYDSAAATRTSGTFYSNC